MIEVANKIALVLSIVAFTIANFIITLAFVIAPVGSIVPQLADRYKLASLIIGCVLYFVFIRKGWMFAALLVPFVQFVAFLWFTDYLNSLPFHGIEQTLSPPVEIGERRTLLSHDQ